MIPSDPHCFGPRTTRTSHRAADCPVLVVLGPKQCGFYTEKERPVALDNHVSTQLPSGGAA
jgi:hypothetical protein